MLRKYEGPGGNEPIKTVACAAVERALQHSLGHDPKRNVTPNSHLTKDLGVDSLTLQGILSLLEAQPNTRISYQDLQKAVLVSDIDEAIARVRGEAFTIS
ncbi:MAG TPA: phosphopantetheine-binding protein [Candidatus Peribacterales bacterium]|nr:phosphopantetheine-binding protein [Candidatus Peribacterales bacterium]